MTDEQVLKIIEKMGPEASGAIDSWLTLQWTKFWFLDVLAPICLVVIVISMIFALFFLPTTDKKSEEP